MEFLVYKGPNAIRDDPLAVAELHLIHWLWLVNGVCLIGLFRFTVFSKNHTPRIVIQVT